MTEAHWTNRCSSARHTAHTRHLVSICMLYVLGIASVSLCWSRQSWARPTDNHEEEETEELGQQRQQQRGHHRRQEAQPRHQLQPLQSGTCKHQLHSVCLLFYFFSLTPHACLQGYTQAGNIPNGIAAIRFNLFAQKREKTGGGWKRKPVQWDKETSRDLYENISPQDKEKTLQRW